jgi:hypothetical protein
MTSHSGTMCLGQSRVICSQRDLDLHFDRPMWPRKVCPRGHALGTDPERRVRPSTGVPVSSRARLSRFCRSAPYRGLAGWIGLSIVARKVERLICAHGHRTFPQVRGPFGWWPGAGSNRRPSDFQQTGRTPVGTALTCSDALARGQLRAAWARFGHGSPVIAVDRRRHPYRWLTVLSRSSATTCGVRRGSVGCPGLNVRRPAGSAQTLV